MMWFPMGVYWLSASYCWPHPVCGGGCDGLRVAEGGEESLFSINKGRDRGRACIGVWRGWKKSVDIFNLLNIKH